MYKDLGNGLFQRNRLRRRPGTVAVAAAIQNKYNITVVPHILCSGFTREETEYVLLDLQFLNITELLVLRGDKAKHESVFTPEGDGYHHAIELQEQINNFNKGIFCGRFGDESQQYAVFLQGWLVIRRSTKKRLISRLTFTG